MGGHLAEGPVNREGHFLSKPLSVLFQISDAEKIDLKDYEIFLFKWGKYNPRD